MNKIFFYNIIFFSFINLFCSSNNQEYLLNIVNGDKNQLKKIAYKEINKVNNISRRGIFISYGGLEINYEGDEKFEIYENSDYKEYKKFIEEYLIPYFGKILDKKDQLEKYDKSLNLEFIKIFIVKLLTDYFPLNLENLNFKEKKGIFFKENIKKNFLEKFFDFYNFIENKNLLKGNFNKDKFLKNLEKFESENLKNGEKNFLNFYSFNLLENLAANSFLILDITSKDVLEKKIKDKFFQKNLLPFLGLILEKFNKEYEEKVKKLGVREQNKFKQLNDKKFKLEKVVKKILMDFYEKFEENKFGIIYDVGVLNKNFVTNFSDIFASVEDIYVELALTFFEKIKIKKNNTVTDINSKIRNKYQQGKEKVDLFKSDIKNRKDSFLNKKDQAIVKTANFLESFIKNETLKNSKKIIDKDEEIKKKDKKIKELEEELNLCNKGKDKKIID